MTAFRNNERLKGLDSVSLNGTTMFDPSLCGFATMPSAPVQPVQPAVLPQKRQLQTPDQPHERATAFKQRDDPSLWCGGSLNINATQAMPAIGPTALPEPPEDPRRAKFTVRDKRFPMAGLMREDGGVFAFMDTIRAERRRVPSAPNDSESSTQYIPVSVSRSS